MFVTFGTTAGCNRACDLVEGISTGSADKGYDSDALVEQLGVNCIEAVIPPGKHRKERREYDKHLYRLRHLVENAFLQLKAWRGIAKRYADFFLSGSSTYQVYRNLGKNLLTTRSRPSARLATYPDPEINKFEEALLRSIGQARRGVFAAGHTPKSIARGRPPGSNRCESSGKAAA